MLTNNAVATIKLENGTITNVVFPGNAEWLDVDTVNLAHEYCHSDFPFTDYELLLVTVDGMEVWQNDKKPVVKRKHLYNAADFNGIEPVQNIITVYNAVVAQSSSVELVNAAKWYEIAHKWCMDVASAYGLTVSQVAGITAAMSPQINWTKNKLQTVLLIEKMRKGEELTGLMAYRVNVEKARRIYMGENALDVLGGQKVRSFYGNLMLDDSTVTIDRHALHIALHGTGNEEKSGSITPTPKLYDIAQDAYKTAAKILGITPYSLQSITWTFKAQNGGKVQ